MPVDKSKHSSKRTLKHYIRAERQQKCKICQLPSAVKHQLVNRNRQTVTLDTVVEWIRREWGFKVTREDFLFHYKALHERDKLGRV